MTHESPIRFDDDMHWQAFRYVTGEMSEIEVVAFDERLMRDTELCDVLSLVVRATQSMSAVLLSDVNAKLVSDVPRVDASPVGLVAVRARSAVDSIPESQPRLHRRQSRFALAASVLVLMASLFSITRKSTNGLVDFHAKDGRHATDDQSIGRLVSAWLAYDGGRSLIAESLVGELPVVANDAPGIGIVDSQLSLTDDTSHANDRLAVPDWMMVALADSSMADGDDANVDSDDPDFEVY